MSIVDTKAFMLPITRHSIFAHRPPVTEYVEDLRNVLTHSSIAEQRTFIRSFVKEVKVTGNEAVLIYTMPLPPQETTQERMEVLNTVHYGGRYWTIDRTFELAFVVNI